MNKEQEYIKFWTNMITKLNEIERDYNNLSYENKLRVDTLGNTVLNAHTFADAVKIICSQINMDYKYR